jgi:hypothetical protein
MRLLANWAAVAVCVAALSPFACPAQSGCTRKRVFSGEEDSCLDNAPSAPPLVVAAILNTKIGKESFNELESSDRLNVAKLFKGLTVHLRNQSQQDMIVRGDPPMSGGDNTWFWIVTSVNNHPFAFWVQGNGVTILRTSHHRYADIQTDWAAGSHRATRVFRHNGKHYKLYQEEYEDLPPS